MLRSQCCSSFRLTWLLLALVFLSLQGGTYAQEKKAVWRIMCPEKNEFAIQTPDSTEIVFYFQLHMQLAHDKKLTATEIFSILNSQKEMTLNPALLSIKCPQKDGVEIYGLDKNGLVFEMGTHMQLIHNKKLTDEELLPLIK